MQCKFCQESQLHFFKDNNQPIHQIICPKCDSYYHFQSESKDHCIYYAYPGKEYKAYFQNETLYIKK